MAMEVLHHHCYPLTPVKCLPISQQSRNFKTGASAFQTREKQDCQELQAHLVRKGIKENRVKMVYMELQA